MGETFEVDEREAWIRHAAALRALARSLISDEHEAEDVVQETWLRFLRTDPGVVREPRTWLSRALRNVSIERFRGRARRRQREELAAQRESVPSSDELLARMELLKRVADHVTALDEPYRSAVHLRYFEGLGVGEIARATGEKLETVRTRLRRGRALLRERLDAQEHGDRDSWCQALAPLAGLGVPELAAAPVAGQPVVPLLGALEMSLRTSLTLALSLALVAGVIWRTTLHSSEPQEVEAVASGADEPFTASPGDELQSGVLPSQEPEAPMREVADVAPAAVVPEEDLAQAPVAGLVSLTGRLVVVDEGGSEHAEENGRLAFHCTSFRGEEWVRAEVRAGAWSCEVPSGARLRVGHVEARGRLALSEDSWVADVDTEGLQVRAAWTSDVFLRVVSAATGEDLDSVTVMSRWMWRARIEELLPSEGRFTEEVARGALSPIALPDSAKRVTYWAKAPGYAWGMIHVDHEVGGERRLELAPASSLTVHVAGELPPPKEGEGDFVRLRRKSTGWHWNFAASRSVPEEGPTEFEGLPAGRYLVCYERGDEEGARRGVEQWVDVPEAIDSKVTLTPDVAQLEPPTGRVFGSLYLPVDEREAKHIRLGLTPLDESGGGRPVQLRVKAMQAVDGEEHEYRWDAGELVPGAYIAYVSSLQHRVVFDVVADCENEVRIAVPELATLWLEVVDAIDGSALREAQVRWSDGDLEGVSRNQQIDAPRDARSKRWKLVAPAGTIQFSVHLEGYGEHYETLELAAGESTRRIELSSSTGLRITFVEAGVPVRAEFRSWSWVNAKSIVAGAPTDPVGLGFGRSTEFVRELFIEDPGEYELTFGELEGFAPIPPRRVEVVANEVLSFEVELVRQ